jgi:hypothetical protein
MVSVLLKGLEELSRRLAELIGKGRNQYPLLR